jgi:hypothetical protein
LKNSAKLQAVQDIKMDPEFQQKEKENALTGMGVVRPGYIRFEQQLKKHSKKQSA